MSERPNIIFLLNDHQAYYGHGGTTGAHIKRPIFKKFAKEGIEFMRAYTACPLCAPARRSMLTGLFPHNHKEIKNETRHPFDRMTYLLKLAKAGYRNYVFGKWHAGLGTAYDHKCEGFSRPNYGNPYESHEYKKYLKRYGLPKIRVRIERQWFRFPLNILHRYIKGHIITPTFLSHSGWATGTVLTPKETHEAFFLANLASEKLREIAKSGNNTPFHLRVDFWGPHQAYFTTKEFLKLYNHRDISEHPSFRDDLKHKPKIYRLKHRYAKRNSVFPHPFPWHVWQEILLFTYAQISLIDQAGGLILKTLEETGLANNTLVIWSTDHGDAIGSHGGLFDKDCYMSEELMRVPLAVRFPDEIPAGQISNKLVSNIDFAPTFLDAAKISFKYRIDGQSLLPLCRNQHTTWREDLMAETHGYLHHHLGRMIVTDRYKYIYNEGDLDELYDLKEDPFELKNLIANKDFSATLADMKNRLKRWRKNTGDRVTKKMISFIRNKLKS